MTKEAKKMEDFNKENLSREAFEGLERPERIPCCDSVEDFLSFLRRSQEYRDAVAKRYAEAMKRFQKIRESGDLPPTFEEAAPVYEETSDFKQLFWNFEQDVVHLRYKPEKYNQKVREAVSSYLHAVLESQGVYLERGLNADRIASVDANRKLMHSKAGEILHDQGVVPNFFVGRIVIRAFLIDRGLDSIRSARREETEQESDGLSIKLPRFTPERATDLLDSYLQIHPEIDFDQDYCQRTRYETMSANFVASRDYTGD